MPISFIVPVYTLINEFFMIKKCKAVDKGWTYRHTEGDTAHIDFFKSVLETFGLSLRSHENSVNISILFFIAREMFISGSKTVQDTECMSQSDCFIMAVF